MDEKKTTDDGGPAFPHSVQINLSPGQYASASAPDGMSLRDYFAGQALVALAHYKNEQSCTGSADLAYAFSDAMIAARKAASS